MHICVITLKRLLKIRGTQNLRAIISIFYDPCTECTTHSKCTIVIKIVSEQSPEIEVAFIYNLLLKPM